MAGIQFGGFAEEESGGCGCCEDRCSCEITVCVKDCIGTAIPGATVTLKLVGETKSICTTNIDGCCTMAWETECPTEPTAAYDLIVSKTGYRTYKKYRSLTCGNTYTVVLLRDIDPPVVLFHIVGCCNQDLPGATVIFGDTEYTTDIHGNVEIEVTEEGTYDWSVSKFRFVTKTGTITINPCFDAGHSIILALDPGEGYHCGFGLADPLPETLSLTDSILGATSLVWGFNAVQGLFGWMGTLPVHTAAQDVFGFPGVHCPETTGHVDYFQAGCVPDGVVFFKFLTYVSCRCITCVDGFKFINFGSVVAERIFPEPPCDPLTGTHSMVSATCGGTDASNGICPEDVITIDPDIPLNYNSTWCGSMAHFGTPNRQPWPVNFFTITITE